MPTSRLLMTLRASASPLRRACDATARSGDENEQLGDFAFDGLHLLMEGTRSSLRTEACRVQLARLRRDPLS